MSASGAGGMTTGIGPVDALIDVARGPCVDSVAVRGEVAEALLGLAGAVGEAVPETGQWLGVEGQLEALGRIEAGLVQVLEEVRGKVHARAERGLRRLCWCVQVAQDALQDMVQGTLVRDEWVDGSRLDRVYGGIVGAWRHVSFWLRKCDVREAVLRGLATWVPRHVQGVCGEGSVRDAGGAEVGTGVGATQAILSAASERLNENGESDLAGAVGDVAGMAEALGKLGSLGVPEVEVVEGEGVGASVAVGLVGGGRAFMRADGGGMVLEWRSEFKVPVWLGEGDEGEWAAKCRNEVNDAVSGLLLGQRLNTWAEGEGCAPPVQALRGVAVRVEQSHVSGADPLGAWTCLVLQVTVDAGVSVADVVGDEAWEDMEGGVKAGVARKCLGVLSACEESGAGYAGGGILGALVVEGCCGMDGGTGGVVGDVVRGVASLRLCAGSVGLVVGEAGRGEWRDALRDVVGLECRVGDSGGGESGRDGVFARNGEAGSVDMGECHTLVCVAQRWGGGCDNGVGSARGALGGGGGSGGGIGRVWDAMAGDGGDAQELWDGMRGWRVDVKIKGGVQKAGRCSGLVDVVGKVGRLFGQGSDGSGCVGVWRSLVGGSDVVSKVVEHMRDVAEIDHGAWCGEVMDVQSVRRTAEAGDACDCWELGRMYENGTGVAKDEAEAVRWFRAAAEQGHAEGQTNLGVMYANGRGVAKDGAEAVRWYRAAAEQGHALGQNNLGVMYTNGRGVAKDEAEAVRWCRAAAEQGYAMGQRNLGWMYANGRGVAKDEAEAVRWYRAAAEQGHAMGQNNLGVMYEDGKGVAKDEAEAVRWYRAAAEQGHANGQFSLGVMYANGRGVAKDKAEAVRWYRAAAEQGHAGGQCNLGVMYDHGRGVAKDEAEAVRWYRAAAEQGNAYAISELKRKGL